MQRSNGGGARRYLILGLAFLFGAGLFLLWTNARQVERLYRVVTLFDEDRIVENFRSASQFFPYHEVRRSGPVAELRRTPRELPRSFAFEGETIRIEDLLEDTWTTGLLVLKDDAILFERYYLGNDEQSLNISWSVGKSFVSALIGIALEEGLIADINVPVSDLVPRLKGTGYEGVALKNVLQMSSGVGFDEDYADFFADINRMGRVIALGGSINDFAASLKNERRPGTFNKYVSMDTQILGMVLREATGRPLAEYLEQKIWSRIGMESDARWLVDDSGMELAFGTLNVTLRDFARFGRLYMNGGAYRGRQIVPEEYVRASVTPDAPHLRPNAGEALSDTPLGYGYQWWIPTRPENDFMAIGVYGQWIYVNPARKIVIVKTSADPHWIEGGLEDILTEVMFQSIARSF